METPSQETIKTLHSVLTEITAGMVLNPLTEGDKIWNDAHQRARKIIISYKEGRGLFQK
jgi:hypothetical protein